MAERKSVTKEMARRYQEGTKGQRTTILNELCTLTGWTRRHARRALQQAASVHTRPRPRRPRQRLYEPAVIRALEQVWRIAGGPCGKRLAPFLGELVMALERHGEIDLHPDVRRKLVMMSAATIDRVLAPTRRRFAVRGRSGTKPGTLLRNQIPIRTFADWDEARPGFCEIDLVGHDGGVVAGMYCQTLDLTDVFSGWTVVRAVPNKAQKHVFAALRRLGMSLPFPLLGLDSDNGTEFINNHLIEWCQQLGITFTRSRPYRKNDNCFVEQKNWTHVRQQVGYARYDTPAELRALNELYDVLALWVNFFSPQQRLIKKVRHGAAVTRYHDVAATPYQRLLASQHVSEDAKITLRRTYLELNPAELSRQIGRLQKKLLSLVAAKARKGVKPPPAHGPMRTFSVRQRKVRSRTS